MSSIPETQRAVIIQQDRSFAVETTHVLKPGPGEILIKVHAVAQNPSEWRAVQYPSVHAGTGTGSDVAGEVIALGEGKYDTDIAIGDRIAAFTQGAFSPRYTTFREYAIVPSSPVLKIPANISYEEAASIPLTACTAALGLARLYDFPDIAPLGRSILIWGGSSSLGLYAIQLARLSNLHVIATSSPHNFELVKSYGAHSVIDYRSVDVLQQIRSASPSKDGVDYILDALSESATIKPASHTLRTNGPRKAAVVLPIAEDDRLHDVEYRFVFMSTLLGADGQLGDVYVPPNYRDVALGKEFYALLHAWLSDGKFRPNPITLHSGGLEAIPEGIRYMQAGNVSGTKLVYRLA